MKTIYKYGPVTPDYDCTVEGTIVHVGMQGRQIYVWAEQNPNMPKSMVKFVPTGLEYDGIYVGTVLEADGLFVWHVIMKTVW